MLFALHAGGRLSHVMIIFIIVGLLWSIELLLSLSPTVYLTLNYQELDIEEENIKVVLIVNGNDVGCDIFISQGFTLTSIQSGDFVTEMPEIHFELDNLISAKIPSDQLTSSTGDPILYRLIAMDENGHICSQSISQDTFYRFDGMYICCFMS